MTMTQVRHALGIAAAGAAVEEDRRAAFNRPHFEAFERAVARFKVSPGLLGLLSDTDLEAVMRQVDAPRVPRALRRMALADWRVGRGSGLGRASAGAFGRTILRGPVGSVAAVEMGGVENGARNLGGVAKGDVGGGVGVDRALGECGGGIAQERGSDRVERTFAEARRVGWREDETVALSCGRVNARDVFGELSSSRVRRGESGACAESGAADESAASAGGVRTNMSRVDALGVQPNAGVGNAVDPHALLNSARTLERAADAIRAAAERLGAGPFLGVVRD